MSDATKNSSIRCSLCGCSDHEGSIIWKGPSFSSLLAPHISSVLQPAFEALGQYDRVSGEYTNDLYINICSECADDINLCLQDVVEEDRHVETTTEQPVPKKEKSLISARESWKDKSFTPESLYTILSRHVVGQTIAKQKLSLAVYEHRKRIILSENATSKGAPFADIDIKKSNVLLLGPTGSGKTYMLSILAKHLEIPLVSFDVSKVTQPGYVGANAVDCISELLRVSKGDVKLAEVGIIYLDEIDKLADSRGGQDLNGGCAQASLLTLIEGSKVTVNYGKEDSRTVDTTNILFVAGGAFVGACDAATKRTSKSSMGFSSSLSTGKHNALYSSITTEDLCTFGMLPELLGRFPFRIALEELMLSDLKQILAETKNSLIDQCRKSAAYDGVKLIFTQGAIHAIAERAIVNKTGARGLRTVLEEVTLGMRFKLPGMKRSRPNLVRVVITEAVVCKGAEPEYKYSERPLRLRNGSIRSI